MKPTTKQFLILPFTLAALLFTHLAAADEDSNRQNPMPCPVAPFNTLTMDEEFGIGAQAITHCNRVRHHAKVVISIAHPFLINAGGQAVRTSARFFSNLDHLVKNYENVHGMTIGKDVEVVVVLVESGGVLAATQHATFNPVAGGAPVANPFVSLVQEAMGKGIKVYLCQTAARNLGINLANMIPGIEFVPGGHIAVADFQLRGYALISLL